MEMEMETVQGTIDHVSGPHRHNFCIATLLPGMQKVTGVFPSVSVGDYCVFKGNRTSHPKYGEQFRASSYSIAYPKSETDIRRYFELKCPGIGPAICGRLFGWLSDTGRQAEDIWTVLKNDPESLATIKGISKSKLCEITEWFRNTETTREVSMFFVKNGVTLNLLERIKTAYGFETDGEVVDLIKKNPYQLADDVSGIGFLKADKIALSMGMAKDNKFRLLSGVVWTLSKAAQDGNSYLPENEFLKKVCDTLSADVGSVKKAMVSAENNQSILIDGKAVYLPALLQAEKTVARRLKSIIAKAGRVIPENLSDKDIQKMSADQLAALEKVFEFGFVIITGGPGTGKTFILEKILKALGSKLNVVMAAPTGKAAKRMTESTGYPAKTIHRLLEYSVKDRGFRRTEENPIDADLLIIDESSMLDIQLAADLFSAVHEGCRVILVGDKDQLPSVGPGTVLKDMIASGSIPVAELTELHRQDAKGAIAKAARDINAGRPFPFSKNTVSMPYGSDRFIYHREDDPDKIPGLIKKYMERIADNKTIPYGKNSIQVLSPQKNRVIGVDSLNPYLRDNVCNPDGEKVGETCFRVGDRVMQIRNNYEIERFNGEIGIIRSVKKRYEPDGKVNAHAMMIDFGDGVPTEYPTCYENDLKAAYAFTIHKSQGSEFEVLIMPIHSTHSYMLCRELIYTGITRGKEYVIIIGNDKAVKLAARKTGGNQRWSGLEERMRG